MKITKKLAIFIAIALTTSQILSEEATTDPETTDPEEKQPRTHPDDMQKPDCKEMYDKCTDCQYVYTSKKQLCNKCSFMYQPMDTELEQAILANWYFAESDFLDYGENEQNRHALIMECGPDYEIMLLFVFAMLLVMMALFVIKIKMQSKYA